MGSPIARPSSLLLLVLSAGCGEASDDASPAQPTDAAAPQPEPPASPTLSQDGSLADANSVVAPYPDGPYGETNIEVGEVLENLSFFGFVSWESTGLDTTAPGVTQTLEDVRASGRRFLLIHTAAFW